MLGIGIIPAIMYVFIYYEYFGSIYELRRWGNILLLSVCFEGYYLLLATWFGGILEPYVKRFFEKRILKKQKQRTLTDADRDNR